MKLGCSAEMLHNIVRVRTSLATERIDWNGKRQILDWCAFSVVETRVVCINIYFRFLAVGTKPKWEKSY